MFNLDEEYRIARTRGWKRSDLMWERMQEAANRQYLVGRTISAAMMAFAGHTIACLAFNRSDPRRIASFANMAFGTGALGLSALSIRMYGKALQDWRSVPEQMDKMHILPRARSSLHHQRMELQHWDSYRQNIVKRLRCFVNETGECLEALINRDKVPHRLYSRWRGEKFPVYDDSRKLLAACLLIIADESGDKMHDGPLRRQP